MTAQIGHTRAHGDHTVKMNVPDVLLTLDLSIANIALISSWNFVSYHGNLEFVPTFHIATPVHFPLEAVTDKP